MPDDSARRDHVPSIPGSSRVAHRAPLGLMEARPERIAARGYEFDAARAMAIAL